MGSYYQGSVPVYEPELHCAQEIIYFVHNRTRVSELGGTVAASLDRDPCNEGNFFVSLVKGTNLYLVVIESYIDLSKNPLNFLCYLSSLQVTLLSIYVDGAGCSISAPGASSMCKA